MQHLHVQHVHVQRMHVQHVHVQHVHVQHVQHVHALSCLCICQQPPCICALRMPSGAHACAHTRSAYLLACVSVCLCVCVSLYTLLECASLSVLS